MSDVREITVRCPSCDEMFRTSFSPYSPVKTTPCTSCGASIPLINHAAPDSTGQPPPSLPSVSGTQPQPRHNSLAGRLSAGIIGGLLMAVITANIVMILFGNLDEVEPSDAALAVAAFAFVSVWGVAIWVARRAFSTGKAWRYQLIPCALLSFAVPLASFVPFFCAASAAAEKGGEFSILEAGATAGVGIVTSFAMGILAFFLGIIFLIIGLLVGKDKPTN